MAHHEGMAEMIADRCLVSNLNTSSRLTDTCGQNPKPFHDSLLINPFKERPIHVRQTIPEFLCTEGLGLDENVGSYVSL